jgi:hypothetical protein
MKALQLSLLVFMIIALAAAPPDSVNSQVDIPPEWMLVFERQPGPDTPTLHDFAIHASSDDDILARAVEHFELNRAQLALLWRENNPARLAGLYAMYVTHISHPYGVAAAPGSLQEHLTRERAHCGTYTFAQYRLAQALGLTVRSVEFVGEHAWVEVSVDGNWEIFDATTNVWISRPIEALLAGEAREFRALYTPMLDIQRPEARLHLAEGYNMPRLRQRMPTLGLSYQPPGDLIIQGELVREAAA